MTALLRPLRSLRSRIRAQLQFERDWRTYAHLPGAEPLSRKDAYPRLEDRTSTTPFEAHYFYQSVWAAQAIQRSGTPTHVDVGSLNLFVAMLSAFTNVTFVDIRPLPVTLEHFDSRAGSILELPFSDDSVPSLSSLHVAEHVGLGRYGDPLDPAGTRKAARELARVLKPGGNLYFSLPVGRPRVCYNAHRIHAPAQILTYFHDLQLVGFAAVHDDGTFKAKAAPAEVENAAYACGLFHFTKIA